MAGDKNKDDSCQHARGPTVKNLRLSKVLLELLPIMTPLSTSTGLFTQEDDVLVIRAYECFPVASWSGIRKLFPNRKKHAVKNRYNSYLKRGRNEAPFTVSQDLLYGCDVPTTEELLPQGPKRSKETMDRLISMHDQLPLDSSTH